MGRFKILVTVLLIGVFFTSCSTTGNKTIGSETKTVVAVKSANIISVSSVTKSKVSEQQRNLMYIIYESYLRVSPEDKARHTADLKIGDVVYVLGESGDFYKVSFDGVVGYVYKENIGDSEQAKEVEENIREYKKAQAEFEYNLKNEKKIRQEEQEEREKVELMLQSKVEEADNSSLSPLDLLVSDIELEGSKDKSLKKNIKPIFARLPEKMIEEFNNLGWRITLTTKDIATEYYHNTSLGHICGLTIPESNQIVYQAKAYKFRRCILHEFFHYIDCRYRWLSETNEWQTIYQKEKNKLKITSDYKDSHYRADASEYFAESFQEYCYNPSEVRSTCPNTYKYIKNFMSGYK